MKIKSGYLIVANYGAASLGEGVAFVKFMSRVVAMMLAPAGAELSGQQSMDAARDREVNSVLWIFAACYQGRHREPLLHQSQ